MRGRVRSGLRMEKGEGVWFVFLDETADVDSRELDPPLLASTRYGEVKVHSPNTHQSHLIRHLSRGCDRGT